MRELIVERDGMRIYGKIGIPQGAGLWPCVIFSHGFGASHVYDSGMEQRFLDSGIAFVAFDFCGGGPESLSSGTMLDMSVLTEAADLSAVIDSVRSMEEIDASRLYLMGSSQGGYVSAYVAALRPDDVAGLVLFFPAFNIADDARRRIEERGCDMPETVAVGPYVVARQYEADALSVDVFDHITGYGKGVLIVHGARDTLVPLSYSQRAAEVYGENCRLVVLEELGHGFRMGPPELRDQAMGLALDFIEP